MTIESATRQAVALFAETAHLTLDTSQPMPTLLEAVAAARETRFLSDGEEALARLIFDMWNASEVFSVHELARLDRATRDRAAGCIDEWLRSLAA